MRSSSQEYVFPPPSHPAHTIPLPSFAMYGMPLTPTVPTYAYPYPVPLQYRGLLNAHAAAPQGKVAELRLELNSSGGKKDKTFSTKRIALKKIVANMTMSNNDMVALFPDVVGVMGTQSLEIKKM